MMTIKILTIGYLMDFMAHIRPEDLEEVEVGEGKPFKDLPISSLLKSGCLCLVDNETNEVYALGGCEDNIVWMLCTTRVENNKIKFLKWLEWMGAKFIKETETETHIAFMFEGRKESDNV